MNRKIHFNTLRKYFDEKYGVNIKDVEISNKTTGETYHVICDRDTDIAVFKVKDEKICVCINSNGDEVDKDEIFGYINDQYAGKEWDDQIFDVEKLTLKYGDEIIDNDAIVNKENTIHCNRTSIVLQTELRKDSFDGSLGPFYVDEVVYVDDEEFDTIKSMEYSEVLEDYNKRVYKFVKDGTHGIAVINEDGDGLLIDTQGYNYARYMSYAPKIAPAIEQMLLEDMRRNAVHTMKLYVPLKVTHENYIDNMVTETEDVSHTWEVQEKIKEFNKFYSERGLAQYLEKNNPCNKKVYSIKPDVECVNDVMMGVIAIKMTKPLNDEEIADIKDFVTEQMADGWGELFEKQGVQVKDGQIFIHFWDKEQYYIKTEDELIAEQEQNMEMEGMQGIQGMSGMSGM